MNPEGSNVIYIDKKRKPRMSPLRLVLFIIAFAVLVCSLGFAGYILYTYWNGQSEYEDLAASIDATDFGVDPILSEVNIDWDALATINSDVVGWVYLPDTVINYPIARREGNDSYYMKHNFGRNSVGNFGAEYGCITLSSYNAANWSDQANFVSGHHMANGTMFAMLQDFLDPGVFEAHRTFYVFTPEGNFKLRSFAVDKIRGSRNDIIIPAFETRQEFTDYIQQRIDESYVTPADQVKASDVEQIVMFYTCSEPDNSWRICVYTAVEEFVPAGSEFAQPSAVPQNEDVAIVDSAVGERLL